MAARPAHQRRQIHAARARIAPLLRHLHRVLHSIREEGLAPVPRLRSSRRCDHGPCRPQHPLDRNRRRQHARTHRHDELSPAGEHRSWRGWCSPAISAGAHTQYPMLLKLYTRWCPEVRILNQAKPLQSPTCLLGGASGPEQPPSHDGCVQCHCAVRQVGFGETAQEQLDGSSCHARNITVHGCEIVDAPFRA